MPPPFPNTYHHRKVAESSAKSCFICYKSSSSVLITPDNKDFFYVCVGHLKDKGFAQPLDQPIEKTTVSEPKQDEALQAEIERVKKEYEEKQKKKKSKSEDKKEDKKDEPKKDEAKNETASESKIVNGASDIPAVQHEPRVFALNKSVYDMRVAKLRNAEAAKRQQERMKNMPALPSVPQGFP